VRAWLDICDLWDATAASTPEEADECHDVELAPSQKSKICRHLFFADNGAVATGAAATAAAGVEAAADLPFVMMAQELMRKRVSAPRFENDIKERTSELIFGFGQYRETHDSYCADELRDLAFVPMWMWGLLGLADNEESRAHTRNPSLKLVSGEMRQTHSTSSSTAARIGRGKLASWQPAFGCAFTGSIP